MQQNPGGRAIPAPEVEEYLRKSIHAAWLDLEKASAGSGDPAGQRAYNDALHHYCRLLHESSLYVSQGALPTGWSHRVAGGRS